MKHSLIILISFLLLSSHVIGNSHKGETLYGLSECLLLPCDYQWIGFGDKDTQPKYQGQVKDGKPNGLGVIFYPDGSKYVGGWENGLFNGKGIFSKSNGTKYVGSWKIIDGVTSHWNGEYYDEDGIIKYKWANGELIKQYKS